VRERFADVRDADLRDGDLRDADLRDADLRDAVLRDAVLRDADRSDADRSDADRPDDDRPDDVVRDRPARLRPSGASGTSAPLARASLNPMAIACLRLRTRCPEPLFRVPDLRRRIAEATVLDALDSFFAMGLLLDGGGDPGCK
jgi:Pentapeptide repeats (8 copies)